MRRILKIFFAFFIIARTTAQNVIINEIMNAPSGGEPEWIEIFNFSTEPVDLKNWKISNRLTSTKYTITTQSYILQPDSYAVITRSDTIFYFHSQIPSKVFILPGLPSSRFRNDSDAVVLFDSSDVVIDSVYYKSDWVRAGYSIERIYPNKNSNLKSTWGISTDPERSTPGRKNSIMAKFNDLAIKTFSTEPTQIFQGQSFKIKTTLYNQGINAVDNFKIEFFIDLNRDSSFQSSEKISELTIQQRLESTDSIFVEFEVSGLASGNYQTLLQVLFSNDENTSNNLVKKNLTILPPPLSFNSIVINEIMYAPKTPEPEWIEIYNRTNQTINLKNWKIGDSQTLRTITLDFNLNPNDFAIITSKDTLLSFYPWLKAEKILIQSLPAFNNDEDAVRIYDTYGNLIDSVYYFSSMGGSNGFSLERISPEQSSNLTSNWGTSKSPFKATPLLKNSLTQKDTDLTISNVKFAKPVLKFSTVEITATIKNIGKTPINGFSTKIFNDTNTDNIPQNNELIAEKIFTGQINSGDSIDITFFFTPTETKTYDLIAKVSHPSDEDTLNNFYAFKIDVSYPEKTILISEIMFAPSGDEPEWVEIYNASDNTINLKNWSISDASTKTTIAKGDFLFHPREYLVLSKDSTILNFYQIPSKIITPLLPTLNNTEDAVAIYDNTGSKIDSVYYFGRWGKTGFSIERIDFDDSSLDSANWLIPTDSIKATPGRENSTKRKNFDLKIASVEIPKFSDYATPINVKLTVQNIGLNQVANFSIDVFKDSNFDSSASENELILSQTFQNTLNKKDSATINFEISNLEPGENALIFLINFPSDENPKNNIAFKKLNISFPSNSIVINEIMFDPLPGYCEYIELFNRSNIPVNLKNWRFNDMRTQDGRANFISLSQNDLILMPGEYAVIASDTTLFKYLNPGDSIAKLIILNKSLSLNNDFDDVVITDLTSKIIDSVRYFSNWHSQIITDKRGRSLEKINPNLPSADKSSWMTSSAKSGGTPGRKNTAYIETSGQNQPAKITVTPSIFSPDGDGLDDVCLISYSLPFNSGTINVKIFDSQGRQIKTLALNQYTTQNGNLLWDGTDENGKIGRIGIYIILFEAVSESGESFKQKLTVVLAKKL